MFYKNKEKQKQTQRLWREKNKEYLRELKRKWSYKNKEKQKQTQRLWREKNKEYLRELKRKWYEKNYKDNPESSFDLRCPVQQLACFHYNNLQPLWAEDNIRKRDKINYEVE
jgi:hypothetical protein